MRTLRFSTAKDLYDAFATAEDDVGRPAADVPSLEHLRMLGAERDWPGAISFCAYLLSRHDAVAWGCRALRRVLPITVAERDRALAFAEAWVELPQELQRRKALALGNQSDMRSATTWLALGAGWSGGNIVSAENGNVAAKAEQTPRAIRAALLIALAQSPPASAEAIVTHWLEDGIRLASGKSVSP
jgi:hypothetical protein